MVLTLVLPLLMVFITITDKLFFILSGKQLLKIASAGTGQGVLAETDRGSALEDELKTLFDEADKDQDGKISFAEMVLASVPPQHLHKP